MVAIIIILTEDTEKWNSWSLTLRCLCECAQLDPWHGSPAGLRYSGVSELALPPWLYTRRTEGGCWWWPSLELDLAAHPSVLVGTHFRCNLWCLLSATSNTFFLKPPPLLQTETKLKCITWNWGWKIGHGASLVAQWLRICLPMQGTRVRALVWEDPTCCGAAEPVSHNYWAWASGACALQQERPR